MRLPHRNTLFLSSSVFFTILALILPARANRTQQLVSNPSSLNFHAVQVGQTETQVLVLTNSGSTPATVSAVNVPNPVFQISGATLPVVVAAGQSISLNIVFAPTASTWVGGHLTVTSSVSNSTLKIPIQGSGFTNTTGQLSVTPSVLNLGSVTVGSSASASGSLSATGASVTINAASSSNSAFTLTGLSLPTTIAAGQTIPFSIAFSPTATGSLTGTLSFTSNAQTPTTTESVSGTGTSPVGQLTVSPTSLSFGNVVVGSSSSASGTLSASGASVTISSDSTTNTGFKVSGLALPVTIPAGQSLPFTVTYSPGGTGSTSATLSFTSNAQTATTTESLSGTGTAQSGQLAVSPTAVSFGNVNLGSSATQACTLSASGAAVTVNSAALGNSQFALSGASFPMTLSAGQSAQINIIFSPTASGTDSGTLTLTSNASNSTATESLSGVGVAPHYTVSLTWDASTSSVAGYNIYRGTSPGSYAKINSTLNANTAYTDSTVAAGITYYYAATAVNSSGQESGYSTPLQVAIP